MDGDAWGIVTVDDCHRGQLHHKIEEKKPLLEGQVTLDIRDKKEEHVRTDTTEK